MSLVALKRKVNAKKNISNSRISRKSVPASQPGVNAKRGLVARATGSVTNRRTTVTSKVYKPRMVNEMVTVQSAGTNSGESGFSLNGKLRINNTIEDTNLANLNNKLGCCSDDNSSIKRTVSGTKGMLQSRKFRNNNCCTKSDKEKLDEKKSVNHIKRSHQTASDIIRRKKYNNEICNLKLICDDTNNSSPSQTIPYDKDCCKYLPINHPVGVAVSQSDYITMKNMEVKLENMEVKLENQSFLGGYLDDCFYCQNNCLDENRRNSWNRNCYHHCQSLGYCSD